MKLPIKKKYFDEIKSGKKTSDYRDGHITFICEETGEQLRKEVRGVSWCSKEFAEEKTGHKFEDDNIMIFNL